jgi:hypothetical protein
MAKGNDDAPHLVRADIEEFLKREERRKGLQREAEALARENEPLKQKITRYVELKGGSDKTIERSGYILALKTQNGQIVWKTEFIRVAGSEEAAKVAAQPPQVVRLSIEKA